MAIKFLTQETLEKLEKILEGAGELPTEAIAYGYTLQIHLGQLQDVWDEVELENAPENPLAETLMQIAAIAAAWAQFEFANEKKDKITWH